MEGQDRPWSKGRATSSKTRDLHTETQGEQVVVVRGGPFELRIALLSSCVWSWGRLSCLHACVVLFCCC